MICSQISAPQSAAIRAVSAPPMNQMDTRETVDASKTAKTMSKASQRTSIYKPNPLLSLCLLLSVCHVFDGMSIEIPSYRRYGKEKTPRHRGAEISVAMLKHIDYNNSNTFFVEEYVWND